MNEELTPKDELTPKEETQEKIEDKEENEDFSKIIKEIKDGYEEKLLKQEAKYNKKLAEQKNVIKQLLLGDGDANTRKPTIIDLINARRSAQCKKW